MPTRCGLPPFAASALALAFAQTTTPHILSPHGLAATWTLFAGFCQTPYDGLLAGTAASVGVASSNVINNRRIVSPVRALFDPEASGRALSFVDFPRFLNRETKRFRSKSL
jgi:hypothetical protein